MTIERPDPTPVIIPNPSQFQAEVERVTEEYFKLMPFIAEVRGANPLRLTSATNLADASSMEHSLDFKDCMGNALSIMQRMANHPKNATVGARQRLGTHFQPYAERTIDAARSDFRDMPEALGILDDVSTRMTALFQQVASMRPAELGTATRRLAGEDRTSQIGI